MRRMLQRRGSARLMARIEAGENRNAGRAREWLAKAARGAPDPAWVAPDGTVSTEWHALAPKSGALGAFEWKTPAAAPSTSAEEIMAEMSALDVPAVEAVTAPPAPPPSPAETVKPEIVTLPKASVQLLPPEEPVAQPDEPSKAAKASSNGNGGKNGRSARTDGFGGEAAPAQQPKSASAAKPQADARKLNIFVPGPAPDDPGPHAGENDELPTPLSRFRRPS